MAADYDNEVLKTIVEIHRSLGANLELEKSCQILVSKFKALTGCSACAIMLIEDQKVGVISEEGFRKRLGQLEFTTEMPAIKYITTNKQSIITGDVYNSPARDCVPHGCAINSLLCVPIFVNDEVKGIIHLDADKKNAFSKKDVDFIQLLAVELSAIIERSLLYKIVKELSIRDGLTGCFNRRKFDEDIEHEIARAERFERTLSLLMTDIDWFKEYNDFHGHQKGDSLLKEVTYLLSSNIRIFDTMYRYGGEEFTVMLPETDKDSAFITAEKLRQLIEKNRFEGEEKSQPNKKITISIGVSNLPLDAKDKDGLIKSADSALYRAKQSCRNKVCIF